MYRRVKYLHSINKKPWMLTHLRIQERSKMRSLRLLNVHISFTKVFTFFSVNTFSCQKMFQFFMLAHFLDANVTQMVSFGDQNNNFPNYSHKN